MKHAAADRLQSGTSFNVPAPFRIIALESGGACEPAAQMAKHRTKRRHHETGTQDAQSRWTDKS
jgi:hypothetical protein